MNSKPQIEYDEDVLLLEETTDVRDLIVYNDDINTFDHVIKTLIDVCGHEPEQAEQCTLLIHYKGQCTVKHGAYDEDGHVHRHPRPRNLGRHSLGNFLKISANSATPTDLIW